MTVRGEKAKYLSSVLRCSAGDLLSITDHRGNSYSAKIISISRKDVTVEVLGKLDSHPESSLHISLLQGILKGEKMDLVIQKATELGVDEIRPVITERSQVRQTRKLIRWRKIAEEAARQCGRSVIPVVHEPLEMGDTFTTIHGPGIIFWEQGGERFGTVLNRFRETDEIRLFTGPEGGFSEGEIEAASQNGFVTVSLGKRILRAETAAISAVAIVQFSLGDMNAC